jgi:hypothetical protein
MITIFYNIENIEGKSMSFEIPSDEKEGKEDRFLSLTAREAFINEGISAPCLVAQEFTGVIRIAPAKIKRTKIKLASSIYQRRTDLL